MTMVTKAKKQRLARPPATMTASEFRAKCLDVMDRIAATGATVIITKRGVPVARAEPVRAKTVLGIAGGIARSIGDVSLPIDETVLPARKTKGLRQ